MHVLILVFPESIASSYMGIMEMLNYASFFNNRLFPEYNGPVPFTVKLVNIGADLRVQHGEIGIDTHYTLENCPQPDMIVVPGLIGHMPSLAKKYKPVSDWLLLQYQKGIILTSSCSGSFILPETGLLDHKEASTSWFLLDDFRKTFPEVDLQGEKLIVDLGNIITSGATFSYINLCIYLINKYFNTSLANYCARFFLVDKGRTSQLPYHILSGHKTHQDNEILKAQIMMEETSREKINLSQLSEAVAMSERNFLRRFKLATGNTPVEYIQRLKVEQAKSLLEEDNMSIKEIGFKIGYDDQSHFRQTFKKYTGLTPTEYKNRFTFA